MYLKNNICIEYVYNYREIPEKEDERQRNQRERRENKGGR